jgi:AraC-like DNA-binding protein
MLALEQYAQAVSSFDTKEESMSAAERYTQCVAERVQRPPRTSGDIRHWDGVGIASLGERLGLEPVTPAPVLIQEPPAPPGRTCPPVVDWVTEAARLTFYLDPIFLLSPLHEGLPVVTGALVWVSPEGHMECLASAVHPALLVQVASVSRPEACIEVVPHLPIDDPLHHHMTLVLQTACHEGAAGRLYAASLIDALAMHFLRRYAACTPRTPAVPDGLSSAKLRRTLAYIQAHLAEALSLTTLAAVVQLSPNHFAALFKRATGLTPHQYVLGCRIAHAKQLLAETDMPLSMIGPQVGWTDQSYFTAIFRKQVAMTPKAYREATQRA